VLVASKTPDTVFVEKPYILGERRTVGYRVTRRDSNGKISPEDLANDRIEIVVKRTFSDPREGHLKRWHSDGGGIVKSASVIGRFDFTILETEFPTGDLAYRAWRVVNPGTSEETRMHLFTAPFLVSA
jgi:hypothetical protein